jgi:hypothetical protein
VDSHRRQDSEENNSKLFHLRDKEARLFLINKTKGENMFEDNIFKTSFVELFDVSNYVHV